MDRLKKAYHHIGVEIPLFLYMVTAFIRNPVVHNLIYEKLCLEQYYVSWLKVKRGSVRSSVGGRQLHLGFFRNQLGRAPNFRYKDQISTTIWAEPGKIQISTCCFVVY